jgi:predicted ATPase with chaperone activity
MNSARNDATSKVGVINETLGERYLDSLTERDIEEWRDSKLKGSKRYRNNILAHAHDRILKVARTLADLSGSLDIQMNDILEAIQYRSHAIIFSE